MPSKRRIKLLTPEVATAATRRSRGVSTAHRGVLLSVLVENLVDSAEYVLHLQLKDPKNGWTDLWTAASEISLDGMYHYLFYPAGLAKQQCEEYVQMVLPEVWRVVLVYTGTPGVDYADTAVAADLIP